MAKIKGMEEHGWLQMTIWMFGLPPSSSVPLQMVICKEDGPLDDKNQGDGEAWIVARNHPCSSVPLQMVICKEDGSLDDQNQRDRGAQIVANDHLDSPSSSVLLCSFTNGHLQRGRSSI